MVRKIEFLLWSLFTFASLMACALDKFNRDYLIMGLLGSVMIKLVVIQALDTSRQDEALHKIANHSWYDEIMRGEPAVRIITPEDYERKYYDFIDIARDAIGDRIK